MRRSFKYTCKLFQKHYQSKGLRIDLQLIDPITDQERWVDTTCIHPTCKSRIVKELKHIQAKMQRVLEQRQTRRMDPIDIPWEGQAARDQGNFKRELYAPLVEIGRKQFQDGRRAQEPVFLAAVATTYGELGTDTVRLQEFIVAAYGRHIARQGDPEDGSKLQDCTSAFRQKFSQRMRMAVAKGLAHMLNQCGLPRQSRKKNS